MTRDPDDLPVWLTVGAQVVTYCGTDRHASFKRCTVEKIGKRDVVLDDGQRFNKTHRASQSEGLRRDGAGGYSPSTVLTHPNDLTFLSIHDRIVDDRLGRRVEALLRARMRQTQVEWTPQERQTLRMLRAFLTNADPA